MPVICKLLSGFFLIMSMYATHEAELGRPIAIDTSEIQQFSNDLRKK